jgi:L-lactate dehydrogenase complex protein LldE
MAVKAERFAEKTHELVSFLVDVMRVEGVEARFEGTVAYHDVSLIEQSEGRW